MKPIFGVSKSLKKVQVRDSSTVLGVIGDSVYVYSVEARSLANTIIMTKEKTILSRKLVWVKVVFLRELLTELGVIPEKGDIKVFNGRVGRNHCDDPNFHLVGADFAIPSPLLLYYLTKDDICLRN